MIFKNDPAGRESKDLSVDTSLTPQKTALTANKERKGPAAGPALDAGRSAGRTPMTAERTLRAMRAMAAYGHRLPAATNDVTSPVPESEPGIDHNPGTDPEPGRHSAPAAQEQLPTKAQAAPDDGESLRPFSGSRRSIDRQYKVYRYLVGFRRAPTAKRPVVVICLECAEPISSGWRTVPTVFGISGAACLGPVPQGGGPAEGADTGGGSEIGEGDGLAVAALMPTRRELTRPDIEAVIGFMLREAGCRPGELPPRLRDEGIDVLVYAHGSVSGGAGACFDPAMTDRMSGRPMRVHVPDFGGKYWAVTVRLRDVTSTLGVLGLRYQRSRTDLACDLPHEPGDLGQNMSLLRGADEKRFRRVMAHLARVVLASACQLEGG